MSNSSSISKERHSKLKHPVHKITAETPEQLFQQVPGLRKFFQRVTIDPKTGIPVSRNFTPKEKYKRLKPRKDDNEEEVWVDAETGGGPGSHFFNAPIDLVKFIKYIVFVYNPDSDLVTDFPEIRPRKEAAASEAGWERMANGDWPLWIEEIFSLKNKVCAQHVLDYLKVLKSATWSEIIQLMEDIDFMNQKRIEDRAYSIKENYSDKIKDHQDKLSSYIKKFYAEHTDLKKETIREIFPISPENFLSELDVADEWFKVRQTHDVS